MHTQIDRAMKRSTFFSSHFEPDSFWALLFLIRALSVETALIVLYTILTNGLI